MSEPLVVGAPAPDFTLRSGRNNEVTLSALRGNKVVLAFYPLDWSPGCQNQMDGFARDYSQFDAEGAKVFGISVDSFWSHKAWSDALGLPFDLLADFHPKGAVAQQYGVYNEERGNARRVTFIIDEEGVIRDVQVAAQGETPTAGMVCEALRQIV
ncbi:MAG TPA: redoxin domain-containing protein [Thermomicrobiales bacterium]|nr:redoxin domain-containing protein [Thermomicrobiales bacterium]